MLDALISTNKRKRTPLSLTDLEALPLVPIMQENHHALEHPIFIKLLKALGLKPPADEQVEF